MEIQAVLERIGLNEKEARVYASLLSLGTASVLTISKKAELKRPTVYLVLDELQRKGLVSLVPNVKTSLFTAESPEKLVGEIRKKNEMLKRFMPEMLAVFNVKKEKPQVQLFQGKAGMSEVYEKIFASGEVWFFATLGDLDKILPQVTKEVSMRAKEHKLKVKEILTGTQADKIYAKKIIQDEYYQLRFSPQGAEFLTDNAIFGNNVAFFSFDIQFFAVVITSKEIVGSVRALYSMAWQTALPFA